MTTLSDADQIGPAPRDVWSDVWRLTITWRSRADSPDGQSRRTTRMLASIQDLTDALLRASYDPRVRTTRIERAAELDMSLAPQLCRTCRERFADTPPRHWWRSCGCGGHWAIACVVCGDSFLYPRLERTCVY